MDSKRTSPGRDRAAIRQRATLRDQGLELVARFNRWMIAGALGVTGAVALLADHAFHAEQAARAASLHRAAHGSAATSTTGSGTGTSTTGSGTGTSPVPAPTPAAPAPSAVVSGGS